MSNLAQHSDWPMVSFGDVVTHIKDRVQDVMACGLQEYIRGEHFEPANLRLIGRSTLGDGKHGSAFCMRFRPGDVLYVSRNPQLRKAAIADFEGICANTTYVCRAKEEYLLQDLLPFIMQTESFVEYTIRNKRGSTNFYLNWSDIAGYEFALPPLEEQRRIVEALQAASKFSDALATAHSSTASNLASYSLEAFTKLHEDISTPKRPLGELLQQDISNGIFRTKGQFGSGTRMINVTDIYANFEVPTENLDRVPVDDDEYESFSAKPGDVIFNRSSLVLSGIGHACLVPPVNEDLVFECHLMRARPNPALIDARFLCYYALSPHGRQHMLSRAQTTTMTTISQGDVREMLVPCPSIEAQKKIAGNLDQIRQASSSLVERGSRLSNFAKVTLEHALSDSTEVPS